MVQQDRLFCFCGIATAETWLTLRLVYQLELKIYNCCKKIITSIVSLCIAKSHRNFLALQMLQKVIDAIAILALFDHLIFKIGFWIVINSIVTLMIIHIAFLLQNAFYFSNASISETVPAKNAELFIKDRTKDFKKTFKISTLRF